MKNNRICQKGLKTKVYKCSSVLTIENPFQECSFSAWIFKTPAFVYFFKWD